MNTLSLPELFAALTGDGSLTRLLELARDEDFGPGGVPGDVTALVTTSGGEHTRARVVARQAGTIAGGACIGPVLGLMAPGARAEVHIDDGRRVEAGDCVATIAGPLGQVLGAERTLLNLVG
ncbi:MAG: hypothetical protein K2Q20_12635, partial [Phycisphaerales bacterium]|nr:hypothetical protein [Phycisphaerales bacterium]